MQIRPDSSSCPDCIPYVAHTTASRAAILSAMRRWARETGEPPREHEWAQPGGKWEREYPTWPSRHEVRAHFDHWPDALRAAGLPVYRRQWTRPQIIAALRTWADTHGRAPTHEQWRRGTSTHPPTGTVTRAFGTWSAAVRAAELTPGAHGPWSVQEVLDGLRAFERDHGRPPRTGDLRDTRGTPYPPATAVERTLGSMRAAYAQLGWTPGWTAVDDEEILAALRGYAHEHGRPPSARVWRKQHLRPGASVIIRRYGTWSAAVARALEPGPDVRDDAV